MFRIWKSPVICGANLSIFLCSPRRPYTYIVLKVTFFAKVHYGDENWPILKFRGKNYNQENDPLRGHSTTKQNQWPDPHNSYFGRERHVLWWIIFLDFFHSIIVYSVAQSSSKVLLYLLPTISPWAGQYSGQQVQQVQQDFRTRLLEST
jgi:hypothetical protein